MVPIFRGNGLDCNNFPLSGGWLRLPFLNPRLLAGKQQNTLLVPSHCRLRKRRPRICAGTDAIICREEIFGSDQYDNYILLYSMLCSPHLHSVAWATFIHESTSGSRDGLPVSVLAERTKNPMCIVAVLKLLYRRNLTKATLGRRRFE